jgi:hypothetical protein
MVPVGLFVPAGPGDEVAEPGEILHHLVDDAVVLKLKKEALCERYRPSLKIASGTF